jgi:hypothetical protein
MLEQPAQRDRGVAKSRSIPMASSPSAFHRNVRTQSFERTNEVLDLGPGKWWLPTTVAVGREATIGIHFDRIIPGSKE